ncbi:MULTISPECIES: MFS transporter [unclassified Rhodococcus (in: high G+C Gram-positive bacteria)]|uniref:MFS transporter n=1 Tax=unclassified Rhodococcus (in: high G+C Gram-positive bacteria) TaxID=192944 RepID=UPI000B9B7F3A|nr:MULTISPECIES: MFS transporter [unclassified Rhodococcus (in: high G+C Gram-positive bacteria)]OZE40155.1 MFS transporter [Rhodococcus sp. 05-2254-4]OZE49723.1 MFS transporter [Rhodococcus sp. 05-2254-3]OZE50362.1 MFS transporter [Rhodococcus sp. 05-2254-2]
MTESATTGVTPSRARPNDRWEKTKAIVGVGAGNGIEYFDWTVYAIFAAFFAPQFFHTGSPVSDLLASFGVFAVGFVARPFGGLLFGWLSDRRGRKLSMTLAVALASIGSLVIGLTPTHQTIGAAAAVVLVLARLAQGVAHGGELPSAQTYIIEYAPSERRGLWSSLIYISNTSGVVAGTLLGALLTTTLTGEQMTDWGWRLPFLLGGVLGLFVLWMRSRMAETEVYEKSGDVHAKTSMREQFSAHRRQVLQVLFFSVGGTVFYYVWAVSAPAYAITVRGIDPSGALWAGVGANVVLIASLPVWGALSDRIGRKPVLFIGNIGIALLLFPLDAMVGSSALTLFLAMSVALCAIGAILAVMPAMMAELFPTGMRAAGVGVPYSIAVAAFGGTAAYVQTFFAERGTPDLFQWYTLALLAVSIAALITIPETSERDLAASEVDS